jgi:CheY-like chemotaxis protein
MVAKTVLVVEDDPFIRIVAEEMFLAAGIEVESVQRADQALDIVAQRSEQTAFLFTDVQTPGPIDGIRPLQPRPPLSRPRRRFCSERIKSATGIWAGLERMRRLCFDSYS